VADARERADLQGESDLAIGHKSRSRRPRQPDRRIDDPGKRDLAIASYQKVLELARDNEHARRMLEELAAGVGP